MIEATLTGFLTSISLILAIGAQNAFVLRQGLARSHVFAVCLTCALSDAILITLGVAGFGVVVAAYPSLPRIMVWAGAAFLLFYGATRFHAAWKGHAGIDLSGKAAPQRLGTVLATCLALTWLNPHVYLDTFGLIGAVSTGFAGAVKTGFAIGAVTASFVFFFSLGYGARLLTPIMQSARSWVVLDILIGLVMWALAVGLVLSH
ncbi:LysE/ArgO family amino acid transporter [Oceanomicrobium pacificus]|uniref:LysE/ArgO family amino acid transporter n=1 Tax=Oceanomicrobium pacificus TaxID=2692916 RepID=UPI001967DD44|nr:LysE/ArgO family amino acid transporter [Oceanomicrobium pacificus]